jgi:hypothetical protein
MGLGSRTKGRYVGPLCAWYDVIELKHVLKPVAVASLPRAQLRARTIEEACECLLGLKGKELRHCTMISSKRKK